MNIGKSICLQVDFFENKPIIFTVKPLLNQFEEDTVIETIERLVAF